MSAPKGWQKGSWRGLPFVTEGQDHSGGRRGVQHELPQGEKPVWEDLGCKAQRYSIECHIIGDDFIQRANAFADALNAPGTGTLIHPWYGSMQVAAGDFTRRDSTTDGGFSAFSIEFLETGLPAAPTPALDTSSIAQSTANATDAEAVPAFAGGFSLDGAQAFVEEHAIELIDRAGRTMAALSALQGGVGPALLSLQANSGLLPAAVQAALRSPIQLGQTVLAAAQEIRAIGGGGIALIEGLVDLLGFGSDLPTIIGDTPARDQQRDNQAAFVQLVNMACAGELVRAIATTDFASYDEAVAVRDAATGALDLLALRQADRGDDAGAAAYDALLRALVRDVTARGGSLDRLQSYTPSITEPALVIAQRLYGEPATIEARAGEIVTRNRLPHPGFVAGGVALQVLTPAVSLHG